MRGLFEREDFGGEYECTNNKNHGADIFNCPDGTGFVLC